MSSASWVRAIPFLLLAAPLSAQSPSAPHATQFWLSVGGGYGHFMETGNFLGVDGGALTGAASLQHGVFVASVRGTQSTGVSADVWDAGLLAGVGTPSRYVMRGSVAAGIGLAGSRHGGTGATLPVEVQLGWRLTPNIGVGAYLFGSFGQPIGSLGSALVLQIGRLY